jgi:DNA polymerase-1
MQDEYIAACAQHLGPELRPYVKAGVPIFAMGRVAQDALLGMSDKNRRGSWYKGGKVYACWHPAYVLRRPSAAGDLFYDLAKINNGGPYPVQEVYYDVWHDPRRIKEHLQRVIDKGFDTFVIDLETDQVVWWKDRVLSVGFAWSDTEAGVIAEDIVYDSEVAETMQWFFDQDVKIIGHNFKFDLRFMIHQLGWTNARVDYDSLIAAYVLDENQRFGLKNLLHVLFDIEDYEAGLVQRYLNNRNDRYSKVPREHLYKYNALDVAYNWLLWQHQKQDLMEAGLWDKPFMFPLMASQMPLTEIELHGMQVRRSDIDQLSEVLHNELEKRQADLEEMAGTEFNPNSWQQVGDIMYNRLGMPEISVKGCKPGQTNATCRDALMKRLNEDGKPYKWLERYSEWKKLEKLRSSYVDNMYDNLGTGSRVHPDHLVYGTEVGRLSARDPAIQTIPRSSSADVAGKAWGKEIRGVFSAPEGWSVVEIDYSQAELRVAACLSHDEFLLEVYREGRDLHSEVARAMFGEDFTKEQRVICKMFNFSYLYGGSEHSFATDTGLSITKAKQFVRDYNKVMQYLAQFRVDQLDKVRSQGFVETPTGRRRRFPIVVQSNYDDARKASVHAIVAGTASDLTLISMIKAHRLLTEEYEGRANVLTTVHDSIILEIRDDVLHEVSRRVKAIMVETGSELFPEIPWKVDVEAGPDWGHIKEIAV